MENMTPRLRGLKAQKEAMGTETPMLDRVTIGAHIRGYRMALEDLKPVLDAAEATQAETHEWYCSVEEPCPLCKTLRDALAGLEE